MCQWQVQVTGRKKRGALSLLGSGYIILGLEQTRHVFKLMYQLPVDERGHMLT